MDPAALKAFKTRYADLASVLDLTMIYDLIRLEHNADAPMLPPLLEAYITASDERLASIAADIETGAAPAKIAEQAHRLCGSAGSMGAYVFSQACRTLENNAKNLDKAGFTAAIDNLKQAHNTAAMALRKVIQSRDR